MSETQPEESGSPVLADEHDSPNEGEIMQWTCHPVTRKPRVSILVSIFVVFVGVLIYLSMPAYQLMFSLVGTILMLATLAKFYLPTSYKLSDLGVTVKTTTQTMFKKWEIYRSCYPDKNGILLSPFVGPSRLENFRGLYVMFEDNKDDVIAFVRERIRRAHPEDNDDTASTETAT